MVTNNSLGTLTAADKALKDQRENADSPMRNPFYATQIACGIVNDTKKLVYTLTGQQTGAVHPYIYAIALRLGPKHEILPRLISEVDPFGVTSASLDILACYQKWAYHYKLTTKDILFLDAYQKVYDDVVQKGYLTK